ncbi:MAG: radical SAM protein [Candidatus Portnoybacteria bacterium]|nr:radical SAM protein [Candidatus Portnoybacteria bacterium]
MAKSGLKKIIRKIPIAAGAAKIFYDWQQEKKLRAKVKKFLAKNELPFCHSAPEKYAVGYEPTIRCNLRCKMCYQGATRALRQEELGAEEVLSVFKKLEPKIKDIKLVGGEPFVRSDIFEMITFWDNAKKRIILQTNCTLINENNIEVLKKNKNITDILTSLDGPPQVHDAIRGVPGTFNRLEKAIKLIKENMPDVDISAFATMLFSDNLDNLFELVDTCKKLGLSTINILFEQVYSSKEEKGARAIFKEVFNWGEQDYRLNTQLRDPIFPEELDIKKLKKELQAVRRYGIKKGCFVNFTPFGFYNNLEQYINGKPGRPFCLKLLSPELRINQKGEVIWCDVIEKSFGSLLEKTPDEIWLSDEYQKFKEYLFKESLPLCRRCCKAIYIE